MIRSCSSVLQGERESRTNTLLFPAEVTQTDSYRRYLNTTDALKVNNR